MTPERELHTDEGQLVRNLLNDEPNFSEAETVLRSCPQHPYLVSKLDKLGTAMMFLADWIGEIRQQSAFGAKQRSKLQLDVAVLKSETRRMAAGWAIVISMAISISLMLLDHFVVQHQVAVEVKTSVIEALKELHVDK